MAAVFTDKYSQTTDIAVERATVALLSRWCLTSLFLSSQQTLLHRSVAAVDRVLDKTTASDETFLNYNVYLALKLWSKFYLPLWKNHTSFLRAIDNVNITSLFVQLFH